MKNNIEAALNCLSMILCIILTIVFFTTKQLIPAWSFAVIALLNGIAFYLRIKKD